MIPEKLPVRQLALIVVAALTGALLLLLRQPVDAGHAAHSPLPTLTPVCLPLLGSDLWLTEAGYVLNTSDSATLSLNLQHQGADDLTRISFATVGWTLLAPANGATVSGLLGDYQVSWNSAAGRMEFTPLFDGYSLGAVEHFSFTVQGFAPAQPVQLTVRKGEDVLETYTIDLSSPACDRTPAPFSPLPTPTPTPAGGVVLPTEPQVAGCVFEPPPGGVPAEPVIPLSAYSFSEPQVTLTHTAPSAIQQWLPDSETLLVSRESGVSQTVSVELVNIVTGVITQVVEPRRYLRDPRWIARDHTVFWRELGNISDSVPGYWEPGYQLRSLEPPSERRLSSNGNGSSITHAISPAGKQAVFLSLPGGTQPLIWNQEGKTLRALPVDLAAWRYDNGPIYRFQPFRPAWHPGGDKILFWDGTWLFLYDLLTNSGCEIDVGALSPRLPFVHEAAWSPNGRYLLLKVAETPPYTSHHGPHDRVLILDTYTGGAVQHALGNPVWNLVWAPDSQTVAMIGETEQEINVAEVGWLSSQGIYLLNIHKGDALHILPDYFAGGDPGLAWSPDGARLAFLGALLEGFGTAGHRGGLFTSQITLNP